LDTVTSIAASVPILLHLSIIELQKLVHNTSVLYQWTPQAHTFVFPLAVRALRL
jgi:hypothetical protein